MKTADFDYHLPEELIAFYPLSNREESRLMIIRRKDWKIEHRRFYELPEFLKEGDVIVLNNTRVIPARLFGKADTGKRFDVLLTERINSRLWKSIMKNPKHGMRIEFDKGLKGKVLKDGKGEWLVEFEEMAGSGVEIKEGGIQGTTGSGVSPMSSSGNSSGTVIKREGSWETIDGYIERFGKMPLPPYIQREPEEKDRVFYQTVYAKKKGAIAAPTAGLHFTQELLDEIHKKGVEIQYITLHVGAGTFKPVKTEDIRDHKIHPEYREIPEETALAVGRAKREGRRIIAVGTTVVRTLESGVDKSGNLQPVSGYTELFIYPGFKFRIVDILITNFHLPRSTLLMLVSAFAEKERILKAYEEAEEKRYRFLSYGNAMLIL